MHKHFLLLLLLASCRTLAPEAAPPRRESPPVDRACLDRARAGTLITSLPARIGDFDVKPTSERAFTLHRAGRALSDDEGRKLWAVLGGAPTVTGLSTGHSAQYSVFKCEGVADASCYGFELWFCQTSLERLAGELAKGAERANVADAELFVKISANEAGGPACTGSRCMPTAHYSTKDAVFRPTHLRTPISGWSAGECEGDGDCEGPGNSCHAWYLRGGAELTIYVQHPAPTFCGCVANQCTWFTQD